MPSRRTQSLHPFLPTLDYENDGPLDQAEIDRVYFYRAELVGLMSTTGLSDSGHGGMLFNVIGQFVEFHYSLCTDIADIVQLVRIAVRASEAHMNVTFLTSVESMELSSFARQATGQAVTDRNIILVIDGEEVHPGTSVAETLDDNLEDLLNRNHDSLDPQVPRWVPEKGKVIYEGNLMPWQEEHQCLGCPSFFRVSVDRYARQE